MTARCRGFSLLEIMLSVSLVAILAGVSVPVYQSFQTRNDLEVATQSVAQSVRRAQTLSQSGQDDSQWGVRLQTGQVVLFRGTSFATRDPSVDEITDLSLSVVIGGGSLGEVVFTKIAGGPTSGGAPLTAGAFVLTNRRGETRSVTVNTAGVVSY